MNVKGFTAIALLAGLLLFAAIFAVRVADHFPGLRAELGEFKIAKIEPATRARLEGLTDRVFLTYFVSPREYMPSHMRSMERDVETLLTAMRDASNSKLDFAIVHLVYRDPREDAEKAAARASSAPAPVGVAVNGEAPVNEAPKEDDDLDRYASNRRISPVRVRSVAHDSYSEQTVWSGISIAYKTFRPAVVNGLEPQHLPRLQALLLGHLDQMERPRKPVVALAVPSASPAGVKATYTKVLADLKKRVETVEAHERPAPIPGKVLTVDLNAGAPIPMEADVLYWVDPLTFTPSRLRELQLFLESGRSVVVAAGELVADMTGDASGNPLVDVKPSGYDSGPLLSSFGLAPVRGFVLDGDCAEFMVGETKLPAPFMFRCIGYRQDFRSMRGQPNGTLMFISPTPMQLDGEKLAERGWMADQLATSSDKTWVVDVPKGPVAVKSLTPEQGEGLAMQPLIVGLRNRDPWVGQVVVCGTGSVFQDGNFDRENTAHWRLLKTLTDTLASDERLVQTRLGIRRPAPVPELEPGRRLLWRTVCVFLLPAGLLLLGLTRGAFRAPGSNVKLQTSSSGRRLPTAVLAAAVLTVAVAASVAARGVGVQWDLTHDRVNRLARESEAIAAAAGSSAIRAELYFSPSERLPADLRPAVSDLADKLAEIQRAGANLTIVKTAPEDLSAAERTRLEGLGIAPVKVTTREEESTVVRNVYCSVRFVKGDRSEVLRFPETSAFESLEFKFVFALWKLSTGRSPHVVFVSDSPRLSPAEAWDMQQAGLNPPTGNDVYSLAREVLRDLGYRISHVNPRALKPALPADTDLMVWFQPRRDCCAMMEEMVRYLHGGGRVALFAQHFVMQSRQYPGAKFRMVYWPQPQFPDIDDIYYPDIGIRATREVLFDDSKTRIELDAQVHRGAQTEYRAMESALPFSIRASAANYDPDSLLTRNLGDQAFLYSSFLEWDDARLRELGLTVKPVWTATDRAWTLDWKGGWLPPTFLSWPPSEFVDPGKPAVKPRLLPRAVLAALFSGTFPLPAAPLTIQPPAPGSNPATMSKPSTRPNPADPGKPAELLFVGCSEAFKNYRITNREFRADQFLANCAAVLALDKDANSVNGGRGLATLASKRPVARGFGNLEPAEKGKWRVAVQAAAPAIFLALGFLWLWRRRSGAVLAA